MLPIGNERHHHRRNRIRPSPSGFFPMRPYSLPTLWRLPQTISKSEWIAKAPRSPGSTTVRWHEIGVRRLNAAMRSMKLWIKWIRAGHEPEPGRFAAVANVRERPHISHAFLSIHPSPRIIH
jgi:hypothetical protein